MRLTDGSTVSRRRRLTPPIPKHSPNRCLTDEESHLFVTPLFMPRGLDVKGGKCAIRGTMKRTGTLLLVLALFGLFALPDTADARVGGGRSFGSRGSRGSASPRTYQAPPSSAPRGSYGAPYRPATPGYTPPMASSGGWMRSLGAGMAGGFLGSMLFSGLGHAGGGMGGMGGYGGGGGIGFMDILLLAGIGYLIYRLVRNRRQMQTAGGPEEGYTSYSSSSPFGNGQPSYATPQPEATYVGEDPTEVLQRHDPQYDPARFKEERLDDFFQLQAAFGNRDLAPVQVRLTPELAQALAQDVAQLRSAGRINRLENIAIRDAEPVEAWHEAGQVFVTVRYRANLVDYTVDEKSGEVVAGSRTEPVKFHELWTFVKDIGFAAQSPRWRLSAIEQESSLTA
jgi:predicted lipid-binding transport protein (Tim44 family)